MREVADILRSVGLAVALALAAAGGAWAQGLPAIKAKPGEKLLVEADELIYDNDHNTVTARGNAELHYGPRTLQADRVRYDRASNRVYAEGNARLTEADGTVVTGERMELTDDFKAGFVDALRVQQSVQRRNETVRTRFSAPRAERVDGTQTSFEYGSYTACEPCKDNPSKPPLWQIRAQKIVHDNQTHTVYFDDATLELAGIPVGYLPYFEAPDPTVRRETGFLTPRFITSTALGKGVSLPYFVDIAPNMDLTLAPTVLSNQGFLGQVEYRHRIDNGFYSLRLSGISQTTPSAFLPSPIGAGDRDFRGSIETQGRFYINDRWRTGWDLVGVTDKWFLDNYRIRNQTVTTDYFREAVSTAYLTGQGDRSWFDARGYYFKGLSSFDWQKQQPIVAPVIDYDKRVNGPPEIGGELRLQGNLTSLTRETTQYQGLPRTTAYLFAPSVNGVSFPLYQTCTVFARGACLIQGLAGTDTRASAQLSWRRSFIDDIGQKFTPFASLRADAFFVNPSLSGYQNDLAPQVARIDDGFSGRVMPTVGLDYRYPFVAQFGGFGVHTLEPIGQLLVRPSETKIGHLPNEDAQSLVFDDTSLFEWDKFSGYDRVEGGVRTNLGGQYSVVTPSGFYANVLFGESVQIAGVNSFRRGDIANVGLDSGLQTQRSDFVGRVQVSPNQNITFISRARFDQADFHVARFETGVTARFAPFAPLTMSAFYSYYEAQPLLGYSHYREGITASATYNITPNWFLSGSVLLDLTHYLDLRNTYTDALASYLVNPVGTVPTYQNPGRFFVSGASFGGGYQDECTTVSLNYINSPIATATGLRERNQTVLLRLELKTLGEADLRQNVGVANTADGIASAR